MQYERQITSHKICGYQVELQQQIDIYVLVAEKCSMLQQLSAFVLRKQCKRCLQESSRNCPMETNFVKLISVQFLIIFSLNL